MPYSSNSTSVTSVAAHDTVHLACRTKHWTRVLQGLQDLLRRRLPQKSSQALPLSLNLALPSEIMTCIGQALWGSLGMWNVHTSVLVPPYRLLGPQALAYDV